MNTSFRCNGNKIHLQFVIRLSITPWNFINRNNYGLHLLIPSFLHEHPFCLTRWQFTDVHKIWRYWPLLHSPHPGHPAPANKKTPVFNKFNDCRYGEVGSYFVIPTFPSKMKRTFPLKQIFTSTLYVNDQFMNRKLRIMMFSSYILFYDSVMNKLAVKNVFLP